MFSRSSLSCLTLGIVPHLCLLCEVVELLNIPLADADGATALVIDIGAFEAETFK
jgi:hypothetical protein